MKLSETTKFFNGLTLRVILLFGIALCYSLLMDYFQLKGMLDEPCEIYMIQECNASASYLNDYPIGFYHTHWSSNHYLYFWMNIALMCVQIFRIGSYIDEFTKKK